MPKTTYHKVGGHKQKKPQLNENIGTTYPEYRNWI